jgi:hypothetical protein
MLIPRYIYHWKIIIGERTMEDRETRKANYNAFIQLCDAVDRILPDLGDKDTLVLENALAHARYMIGIAIDKGEWIIPKMRLRNMSRDGKTCMVALDGRFGCIARIEETDRGLHVTFERTIMYNHDDFEDLLALVLDAYRADQEKRKALKFVKQQERLLENNEL